MLMPLIYGIEFLHSFVQERRSKVAMQIVYDDYNNLLASASKRKLTTSSYYIPKENLGIYYKTV